MTTKPTTPADAPKPAILTEPDIEPAADQLPVLTNWSVQASGGALLLTGTDENGIEITLPALDTLANGRAFTRRDVYQLAN